MINSTTLHNDRPSTSRKTSQNSLSRSRLTRHSTEAYPRPNFEPLVIAAKPLHSLQSSVNTHSLKVKIKQTRPPSSAPPRARLSSPSTLTTSPVEKAPELCVSNLSNNDDSLASSTPSPRLQSAKDEEIEKIPPIISETSTYPKTLSSTPLKSTIELKPPIPRCRSAAEMKRLFPSNRNYPRFILITDQEHRIESWYHQYPFIVSDDLIQSFQSKPNKSMVSAYFIEDYQQFIYPNVTTKAILQGKPFDTDNDWRKYDLIFVSNNIYQQIIIYLQRIINLIMKASGKMIHIYQINHREDLKTQVQYAWKQLNQQIASYL